MQRYEQLWERLLTLLGTLGEVDASVPGRLRLNIDKLEVELVMTEDEWNELVSVPHGSFLGGANALLHAIGRAQMEDLPYLVYDTYELHPSADLVAPWRAEMDAENQRVRDVLRVNPDAKVAWRAHPPGEERS